MFTVMVRSSPERSAGLLRRIDIPEVLYPLQAQLRGQEEAWKTGHERTGVRSR